MAVAASAAAERGVTGPLIRPFPEGAIVRADDGPRVLGRAECTRLLASAHVGRVGFTVGALPAIQPVQVAVQDGRVVIPVQPGDRLAASCRDAVVAVQADSGSPDNEIAWSVEVVGTARVVTDRGEAAALDRLGLQTWTAPGDPWYVTVDMEVISGWRVPGTHPASRRSAGPAAG